jgi:hypothetical protein
MLGSTGYAVNVDLGERISSGALRAMQQSHHAEKNDHSFAAPPPSMFMISAVMNRASSDARNTTLFATSTARPGPVMS